ncbi:MAG: HAMP domain-containing sensor histidine kinase [Opitutales bacterium]
MSADHSKIASERSNPEALAVDSEAEKTARALLEPGTDGKANEVDAFTSFFESSPDPVLLFSPSGEIVAKNDRAMIFWDGDDSFLPRSLIHEVTRSGQSGASFRHSKKEQIIEIHTIRGPRFFLPTTFNLLPASKTGNTPSQLIACILKDETEWARSENIRNNLLSSIHHELNTPLTSARVALYLLAEQQVGTLNEVQTELVGRAKEDLDREIATIQNVLALMRSDSIGSSHAQTSGEAVHLHELLDEAMLEMRELTDSLRLTVNRFFCDAAPQIRMKRETLHLIIKQIFSCIIKHVAKEAVIDVVTLVQENDCYLKLISSDPALVEALPDNLFALPIESKDMRRVQCVDLGLRVAQEIVQEHGGTVNATQNPEAAVLTLSFPCSHRPKN